VDVIAYLAYLCGLLGHVRDGIATGTGEDDAIWASHCSRCGAPLD